MWFKNYNQNFKILDRYLCNVQILVIFHIDLKNTSHEYYLAFQWLNIWKNFLTSLSFKILSK